MESNGFPMCIHVSEPTMELLDDYEDWIQYGSREIKGASRDDVILRILYYTT